MKKSANLKSTHLTLGHAKDWSQAMNKLKKMHFAGGMKIYKNSGVTELLRGWAACCNWESAYKIREEGNYTMYKEDVTCKKCLNIMKQAKII